MQYSIIMKMTMNHFIISYSIIASQKLFYGHPGVTVLSCSTYSVWKNIFLFSVEESLYV